MKKRSRKAVEVQDFEAGAGNGSATAAEESSMEPPRPPDPDVPAPAAAPPHPEQPGADAVLGNGQERAEAAAPAPPESVIPPEEPNLVSTPLSEPMPLTVSAVGDTSQPLELRVRKLEEVIEEIQETRVTDRPPREPPREPPTALLAPPLDVSIPVAAIAPDPPTRPAPITKPADEKRWLLLEMWAEARAIQYMYFDPRYRMSWHAWFIPLILLAMFVTTGWWVPGADIIGMGRLITKAVELVLAFAMFKILGREARRYRETAPDLPAWLRL